MPSHKSWREPSTVLGGDSPRWLSQLVCLGHRRRATVITFNYDTLLESVVATHLLFDWDDPETVHWSQLTEDIPRPAVPVLSPTPLQTMRLLKLHGSLNWYWVPGDATSASIARREIPGWFGAPVEYDDRGRRREVPGRAPFVAPPALAKSAYYQNPLMRELWRQAFEAISNAGQVALIGYSLPLSDLSVADMLRLGLERSGASVVVVNPDGQGTSERLQRLNVSPERIDVVDAALEDLLPRFADAWSRSAGLETLALLRTLPSEWRDLPMLVVWGEHATSVVSEIARDGGLRCTQVPQHGVAATQSGIAEPGTLPTLAGVLAKCGDGPHRVACGPNEQTVIGWGEANFRSGYSGRWNVL